MTDGHALELLSQDDRELSYRENLVARLDMGNPHHGEGGRFASNDAADRRYYVTQAGDGAFQVHDRKYEAKGDEYIRKTSTAAAALEKRNALEEKYGHHESWQSIKSIAAPVPANALTGSGDVTPSDTRPQKESSRPKPPAEEAKSYVINTGADDGTYKRATGESLKAAATRLADVLPGVTTVSVSSTKHGTSFVLNGPKDAWGEPELEFWISHQSHEGTLESVRLTEATRDQGAGKAVLREVMATFDKAGTRQVHLEAGAEVGGYVWARLGANLKLGEGHGVETVDDLKGQITYNADKLHVRGYVDREFENPNTASLVRRLADLTVNGRHVGKALMIGTSWDGVFNLNDSDTRARLNAYTGLNLKGPKA